MYAQKHTLLLVGHDCVSGGGGEGEGTLDVRNKTPFNFNRKQIYSPTEHFNPTKQCDNVLVHHNYHHPHLLQKFKINFCNKYA
jgi:hypothetical protein